MNSEELTEFLIDWERAFLDQRAWFYHWLYLPEVSALAAAGLMRVYAQTVA